MAAEPQRRLSPEEYLAFERRSEGKHEYLAGEVFAMGGASQRHNLACLNVAAAFHAQLRGKPCETYSGDMRVRVTATGLYTYPDVVVVCGPPQFDDAELDTLLNPTLIVEVLSPSTEAYDRGKKFAHYQTLTTLAAYVLVAQDDLRVERFTRQSDGDWRLTVLDRPEDTLALPSIGCSLTLKEIYDRIVVPQGEATPHP